MNFLRCWQNGMAQGWQLNYFMKNLVTNHAKEILIVMVISFPSLGQIRHPDNIASIPPP
jgi:hypothetical protein